jgi:hypothetical protein
MAAMEREIIWEVWGERERGQSSESDGAEVAHQGARDGGGEECLSLERESSVLTVCSGERQHSSTRQDKGS